MAIIIIIWMLLTTILHLLINIYIALLTTNFK